MRHSHLLLTCNEHLHAFVCLSPSGDACVGSFSGGVVIVCGEGAKERCYRGSARAHTAQDQLALRHEGSLQEVSAVLILQLA